MSGIDTPYAVANQVTEYHQVPLVLRSGSYRGLAATANHFARETHMDSLAHAAGMDAVEFPPEKSFRPENAGGAGSRGESVWLAEAEKWRRAGIWRGRWKRKGQLCRYLRRDFCGPEEKTA